MATWSQLILRPTTFAYLSIHPFTELYLLSRLTSCDISSILLMVSIHTIHYKFKFQFLEGKLWNHTPKLFIALC